MICMVEYSAHSAMPLLYKWLAEANTMAINPALMDSARLRSMEASRRTNRQEASAYLQSVTDRIKGTDVLDFLCHALFEIANINIVAYRENSGQIRRKTLPDAKRCPQ